MKPSFLLPVLLLAAGAAHAYDFKSIGPGPAVLYDAPTLKGKKVFVAPTGMPVEVVLVSRAWAKVRDSAGDLSWIEMKSLAPKRTLVVQVPRVKVRLAADDNSATVFTADKGVLLDWVEPATSGWLKVKHRDGQGGFVRAAEVWGE